MGQFIVTKQNFDSVIKKLMLYKVHSLDCEATGLYPYKAKRDRLFSIIMSTEHDDFYFNFNNKPDHLGNKCPANTILSRAVIPKILETMRGSLVFMHNAKYDLALLLQEAYGADLTLIAETIHCLYAVGRVQKNDRLNYYLETLAKDIKKKKIDEVKKYIEKHKLTSKHIVPGKKSPEILKHFDLVPFNLMTVYGMQDSRLHYDVGMYQLKKIQEQDANKASKQKPLMGVCDMERKLTKVLFKMEGTGIKINAEFVEEALEHELKRMPQLVEQFKALGGEGVTDFGPKSIKAAFENNKLYYPLTDKGNPSFKKEELEGMKHPLAQLILDYRDSEKKAGSYYGKILELRDEHNVIHCNFKQGGTGTGRMSCADPNLQNQTKIEKDHPKYLEKYLVRRCYIPRENYFFVMIDFDQMEYRMMLDYAGETELVKQVLNGLDVHQATANLVGVTRSEAKTINFMLLYGGGVAKLCLALYNPKLPEGRLKDVEKLHRWEGKTAKFISTKLGIDEQTIAHDIIELDKAFAIRQKYFEKLPKVEEFVSKVKKMAKGRGYIFNWFGRKSIFNKKTHYKSPNYLIQGGCADIVKLAMLKLDEYLKDKKSRMLIQVHDEIVFEIHETEKHIVPDLKKIMENIYQYKYIPLTCGVEYSYESWQDKKEWAA